MLGAWAAWSLAPPGLTAFAAVAGLTTAVWTALLLLARGPLEPPGAAAIWVWALLVRLAGLAYLPWLEDDWHRYLWDGARLLAGANPYSAAPEAFFTDPDVPPALVPILSGINHPGLATIYGPTLEYLFAAAAWIETAALWPLKLVLVAADLALIAVIGRLAPRRLQWAYALCPLVVLEIAFHAHPDGLAAALAFTAAWLAGTRPRSAALLAALAAAAKPWALLLVPWVLRSAAALLVFVLVLAAAYLPFALGGSAGLEVLGRFARDWHFNAPLHLGLAELTTPGAARAILATVALSLLLAVAWVGRHARLAPGALLFGIVLLLSPVVNPWYLLWLLPFATLRPWITPWVAAAVLPLSYFHGLFLGRPDLAAYEVAPTALAVEWTAIALALARDGWCEWKAGRRR